MGEKQALAAIGQGRLIALWDQLFATVKQPIAQILMTRNDIADRSRYLNATTTFATLLGMGVIPIVNENDTISVSEILHVNKFGDNDTLSAIAAGMCRADYLFLLTDVEGLYEDNPRKVPGARRVSVVHDIERVRALVSTSTLGSSLGTGGMETKLIAAELATAAGCSTVITLGSDPSRILPIVTANPSAAVRTAEEVAKEGVEFAASTSALPAHTLFTPQPRSLSSRRFWILHGLTPRGTVYVDEGAYHAITSHSSASGSRSTGTAESQSTNGSRRNGSGNGGRLLPAGVVHVEGNFAAGQAVRVCVILGRQSQSARQRKPRNQATARVVAESVPSSLGLQESADEESDWSVHRGHKREESADDDDDDDQELERSTSSLPPSVSTASVTATTTTTAAAAAKRELVLKPHERVVEFGRGLTNYNSAEIERVKGLPSREIERVLGYVEAEHVVESVVELRSTSGRTTPTATV